MSVDHISEYHCVEEYEEREQPYGITTHHVTFDDDLDQLYGQLLGVIEADGFELVHVDIDGSRVATFVETDEYDDWVNRRMTWNGDGTPHWVDDRGEREDELIDAD